MKAYIYYIQITENDELQEIRNIIDLCNYINQYYKIDVITKDSINNYFLKRNKKVKKFFDKLYLINRERVDTLKNK